MADDALGLRGFAQQFRPQTGNLNAIIGAAQRQKQADQEFAFKKQQADQTWFDTNSKLGWTDVRSELKQGLADSFNQTYKAIQGVNQKAIRSGGLTQEDKMFIGQAKANYDTQLELFKSFNQDLDKIDAAYKANPEAYNKPALASKMSDLMGKFAKREEDGSVTIDRLAAKSLPDIMEDPETWNVPYLVKKKLEYLKESAVDREIDPNGSTIRTTFNNLWEVDANNKLKYDPKTLRPIFKLNENSMVSVMEDERIRKVVENRAAKMAQDNPNKYKTAEEATKDAFLAEVGPYAGIKDDLSTKRAPRTAGSGKTPKDFNFQVAEGNFANLKDPEQIQSDGLVGTTSKSIDMQGLVDERMVFKGSNNEDVQGKFMGFYTDENGNDAIGIQPYNNVLKTYEEETKLIPLTEKNRTTVRNTITNPELRAVFDKGHNDFKQKTVKNLTKNEDLLNQAVTEIESMFDGSDDTQISEKIRKKLLDYGIQNVEIGANQKTFPWGWNSVNVDGKNLNLNNADDKSKLKDLIYKKSKNIFSQEAGKNSFDPNNPL